MIRAILKTPTPEISRSIEFFQRLNFKIWTFHQSTYVSDGAIILHIDQDRFARPGIILFGDSWNKRISDFHPFIEVITKDETLVTADPNGVYVYLKCLDEFPNLNLQSDHSSLFGSFVGVSIETVHFEATKMFWSNLGYKEVGGDPDGNWASMSNGTEIPVSIMRSNQCPHIFRNPSLTYFNRKNNLEIIKKIRKSNIEITEEITTFNSEGIADNIVITEPGGYGIFVFND